MVAKPKRRVAVLLHGINKLPIYVSYVIGCNPHYFLLWKCIECRSCVVGKTETALFEHRGKCHNNMLLIFADRSWGVRFVVNDLTEVAMTTIEKINTAIIAMIGIQNTLEFLKSHFFKAKNAQTLTVCRSCFEKSR